MCIYAQGEKPQKRGIPYNIYIYKDDVCWHQDTWDKNCKLHITTTINSMFTLLPKNSPLNMSVLGTGMLWFDFGESQQQERPMEGLPRGFPLRHAWRSRIFHQAGPWLSTPVNKMLWVLSKKMMKVCYCIHVVSFMIVLHLSWFQLVLLATKCFDLLYT